LICRTALYLATLSDPQPDFKVTPLFDAECLKNGERYIHTLHIYATLKSIDYNVAMTFILN